MRYACILKIIIYSGFRFPSSSSISFGVNFFRICLAHSSFARSGFSSSVCGVVSGASSSIPSAFCFPPFCFCLILLGKGTFVVLQMENTQESAEVAFFSWMRDNHFEVNQHLSFHYFTDTGRGIATNSTLHVRQYR